MGNKVTGNTAGLVTQAEFARMKGVSRKAITQWKHEDRLVFAGKLVDVAASQASLLRQSSGKSAGKQAAVTLIRQLVKDAQQVTGRVTSNTDDDREIFDGLPGQREAIGRLGSDGCAAEIVAEQLLTILPADTVLGLVETIYARMIEGTAAYLDRWHPIPPGCKSWSDHPDFGGPAVYPEDWERMVRKANVTDA